MAARSSSSRWLVPFARLLVERVDSTDLTQLTLTELERLYGRFNWFAEGDFEGLVVEPNEYVTVEQLYEASGRVHSEIHRRRPTFVGGYRLRQRGRRYQPCHLDLPGVAGVYLSRTRSTARPRTGRARRVVVRVVRRGRRTAPGREADEPELAPPKVLAVAA